MATGLIGALRVTLGIDASEFASGTKKAAAELRGFQKDFQRVGSKFQDIGKSLTKWVTLPVAGAGAAVIKLAGDFQSSMNQLGINANATASEMAAMREQALNIGKDTAKSASEAADAMNMLAKTGVSARDILGGAARAAVNLALATGSELDPATAAISDTMNQFHKTAAQLPDVINQITGAVNQSKFDFADFQLGMGQAGAVAASSGVEFEDFTAALAGTASMFASGSDAGTSFKTFLQFLVPKSNAAAAAMKSLGLEFFDNQGKLKGMADIAQMLHDKLSGLSEEARNEALHDIFGTDAMRTAIGLMNLGAKGIDDFKARIADTSAIDQANVRMQGFNGQLEQLKGALETLAIRIADSGLLEWATNLVTGLSDLVDKLGQTNPVLLKWGTIIAGVAAAFGPFMLVFGSFIKAVGVALPLIAKLGPVFQIMTTAIGYLIPVVVSLSRVLIAGLLANPVLAGAAVLLTGIYLAWQNWDKIGPIVQRLYVAVKTWVLDKLTAVWNTLKSKINEVKGWFSSLYDAVVGHSYIPDMVDEIGKHMARLQDNLVKPVKNSTEAAKQAFATLKQEVGTLLDRLYPKEALRNQFIEDTKLLTEMLPKLGFSASATADALRRLREEYEDATKIDLTPPEPELGDANQPLQNVIDKNTDYLKDQNEKALDEIANATKDKTKEMADAWVQMAGRAVSTLRGMVQAFKGGDILGGIEQIVGLIGGVLSSLSSMGILKTPTGTAGWGGGMSTEGFASGGSFMVGGSGGVDSKLIQFRATPGEMVHITHGEAAQNPREPVLKFDLRGAVMTADLLAQMNAMAEDSARRGAVGGASMAAYNNARARRSQLP
jgi:TP901 family phage tail tape measure protein